jgi:hypothetical protein
MSELYKKIKSVEYKFPDWCTNDFKELISKVRARPGLAIGHLVRNWAEAPLQCGARDG